MFGKLILVFFALQTIAAQNVEVPPNDRLINKLWQDERPSNFFLSQSDSNLAVTKRSAPTDVLPMWGSEMEFKVPKFLVTQNEVSMWSENQPKLAPKPTDNNQRAVETPKPDEIEKYSQIDANDPNKKPSSEDELVKEKIFSLAKDTERDLDAKVKIIEKTNAMFKHNNYYKLGFIVSYINTTHNALSDLMNYVDRNKESWDVLRILNSYVQIKKTKEFITEMVSILNFLQSRSMMMPLQGDKKKDGKNIAWSYYDDA